MLLWRCFEERGEHVKKVAKEMGYSDTSIYKWRKIYVKEGVAGLMKTMKIEAPEPSGVSEEIEALKARIRDLELDNDVLRQTIVILKKGKASN